MAIWRDDGVTLTPSSEAVGVSTHRTVRANRLTPYPKVDVAVTISA